jgi:hypothetical protein
MINVIRAHSQQYHAASVIGTSFPLIRQMNLTDLKLGEPVQNMPVIDVNDERMIDERDTFRPSEFVQRKLQLSLYSSPFPVSCMHSERMVRRP